MAQEGDEPGATEQPHNRQVLCWSDGAGRCFLKHTGTAEVVALPAGSWLVHLAGDGYAYCHDAGQGQTMWASDVFQSTLY